MPRSCRFRSKWLPAWWLASANTPGDEKKEACEALARELYHWGDVKTTPAVPMDVDDVLRYGGPVTRNYLRNVAMLTTDEVSPMCRMVQRGHTFVMVCLEDLDDVAGDPERYGSAVDEFVAGRERARGN